MINFPAPPPPFPRGVKSKQMAKSTATQAFERARAAIVDLLNDQTIGDARRARLLEKIASDAEGFAFDIRARMPKPKPKPDKWEPIYI